MRSLTALVCSGLLFGAVIVAAPQSEAAWPAKVTVKKVAVRPTSFSASGGSVFVKVSVTAAGGVTAVRAQAQFPGRGGPIATLTRQGNTYSGQVRTGANYRTSAARGSLVVVVTTPQRTVQRTIAKLSLRPGDDSLPPPPPS